MISLNDKVILVTGSGRGFGRAMAYAFSVRGANVISVALEKEELDEFSDRMIEGNSVYTIPADISKVDSVYNVYKEIIEEFGTIDSIVNNAAVCTWHRIEETSIEEWDYVFSVNIRAPFLLTKLSLNEMKKKGGSVINITSRSAEIGFINEVSFAPTKWALEGLTQCLALELQPYNISVNTLKVAATPGKRLKPTGVTIEEADKLNLDSSLFPSDEEMSEKYGDAWAFLALQKASEITGQRIGTRELAEYLKENGWDAAREKWGRKLTKAVYEPYEFPEKVRYQTEKGEIKIQKFVRV